MRRDAPFSAAMTFATAAANAILSPVLKPYIKLFFQAVFPNQPCLYFSRCSFCKYRINLTLIAEPQIKHRMTKFRHLAVALAGRVMVAFIGVVLLAHLRFLILHRTNQIPVFADYTLLDLATLLRCSLVRFRSDTQPWLLFISKPLSKGCESCGVSAIAPATAIVAPVSSRVFKVNKDFDLPTMPGWRS